MADDMSEGSESGRYSDESSDVDQYCELQTEMIEWRSSILDEDYSDPPISPPYWDIDVDDGSAKPSNLFQKFTWEIDNFSQVINKKEVRSRVFEMGGYEWYIMIYPQGCDANGYLSLFLCVANHDQLLPGWGHLAQFTVALVNNESKTAKIADTMHRFWKKEHDWGWKRFIELAKVLDECISGDSLTIKTQVQILRVRTDRLFTCLDPWYRRGLLPIYMSNVVETFHHYVNERQIIFVQLRENKKKWSSFSDFWMEMNDYTKYLMMRVRSDMILKLIVKHFFLEKEVPSTLIMDSLHSGLRYLEDHEKNKGSGKVCMDRQGAHVPIIRVEKDMFVLVDDLLVVVERVAKEPLPPRVYEGRLSRAQDGVLARDLNHIDLYNEEERLTKIGRKIIELFSLIHVISKMEVAYQEAVALKKQEELIREEEKEKSKKKQGKQKRKNKKGKDKARDEKPSPAVEEVEERRIPGKTKGNMEESEPGVKEISESSDPLDGATKVHSPDLEDTDELHPSEQVTNDETGSNQSYPNGEAERLIPSVVDDTSFAYSTDPVQSTLNEHSEGEFIVKQKRQKFVNRSWSKRGEVVSNETGWTNKNAFSRSTEPADNPIRPKCPTGRNKGQQEGVPHALPEKTIRPYWRAVKVEEGVTGQSTRSSLNNNQVEVKKSFKQPAAAVEAPSSQKSSSSGEIPSTHLQKLPITKIDPATTKNPSYLEVSHLPCRSVLAKSKVDSLPSETPKPVEKPPLPKAPIVSRSLTISTTTSDPTSTTPIALPVKTAIPPLLSPSASASGMIVSVSSVPTSTTQSYVPHSYRNAIVGDSVSESSAVERRFNEPTLASGNNLNNAMACSSQSVSNSDSAEEFPHLDIINSLFEDEHMIGLQMRLRMMNNDIQSSNNLHHHLNRQLNLSEPTVFSNETVPSCRFNQPLAYHGGNDSDRYSLFSNHQNMQSYYADGQIDGLASNQRQMTGSNMIPQMRMPRMELEGIDGLASNQIQMTGIASDMISQMRMPRRELEGIAGLASNQVQMTGIGSDMIPQMRMPIMEFEGIDGLASNQRQMTGINSNMIPQMRMPRMELEGIDGLASNQRQMTGINSNMIPQMRMPRMDLEGFDGLASNQRQMTGINSNMIPQMRMPRMDLEGFDGLASNQIQMTGINSDMTPQMRMPRMELEGSQYGYSNYSNLACRSDDYDYNYDYEYDYDYDYDYGYA